MRSDDIYESIAKRTIELAGGLDLKSTFGIPIAITITSKQEMGDNFKRAIFDYSIGKLDDTEENKIIVEDFGYICQRLDQQLSSPEEKEEFYKNYTQCILGGYSEFIDKKLIWDDVAESAEGEYPRIEGNNFLTRPSMTNEEVALWLFKEYEKAIAASKQADEDERPQVIDQEPKTYKKSPFKRWRI